MEVSLFLHDGKGAAASSSPSFLVVWDNGCGMDAERYVCLECVCVFKCVCMLGGEACCGLRLLALVRRGVGQRLRHGRGAVCGVWFKCV